MANQKTVNKHFPFLWSCLCSPVVSPWRDNTCVLVQSFYTLTDRSWHIAYPLRWLSLIEKQHYTLVKGCEPSVLTFFFLFYNFMLILELYKVFVGCFTNRYSFHLNISLKIYAIVNSKVLKINNLAQNFFFSSTTYSISSNIISIFSW